MLIYIIFAVLFLFILIYYAAFEAYRYRMAKMLSGELGGRPVFRLGGSYLMRHSESGEERVWIVPDDKMAWGSLLSAVTPPAGELYLRKNKAFGFRFLIEPNTGALFRTLSLARMKEVPFDDPGLDQSLRILTDHREEAERFFTSPEKRQALTVLFRQGIGQIKGGRKGVVAMMSGVSSGSLKPQRIALLFEELCRL